MKTAGYIIVSIATGIVAFLYIRGSICGVPRTAVPSGGPGLTEFASGEGCRKFPWQWDDGQGIDIPLPINRASSERF